MLGADWHKAKGAEVDGGDLTAFLGGDIDRTTARRCRYTVSPELDGLEETGSRYLGLNGITIQGT
jgi:hypothetical protein